MRKTNAADKPPNKPTVKTPQPIPAQYEPTPIWTHEFAERYSQITGHRLAR